MDENAIDLSNHSKQTRNYLKQLQTEFSILFEERSHLLNDEEPLLTALYIDKIGKFKFEEFNLTVALKILTRRMQLLQAYVNRDEAPNLLEVNEKITKEFEKIRQKILEQQEEVERAKKLLSADFLSEEEAKEIKELYRYIVKRLHPDINVALTASEKDLFTKAQVAYKLSDLNVLRQILLKLKNDDAKKDIDYQERNQCKMIEEQIKLLKKSITQLKERFPFNIKENLADEIWIQEEQIKIKESIRGLQEQIVKYKEYVILLEEWERK